MTGARADGASAHDTAAWLVTLRRYLVCSAALHFSWEWLQLPLYTVWAERSLAYNLHAVAHCTLGDLLIAGSTLAAALVLAGDERWPQRRFGPVAATAVAVGACYTVYSEWLNTGVRLAWAYSDAMPVLPVLGTGLAPWLLVPPLALWHATLTVPGGHPPHHRFVLFR